MEQVSLVRAARQELEVMEDGGWVVWLMCQPECDLCRVMRVASGLLLDSG